MSLPAIQAGAGLLRLGAAAGGVAASTLAGFASQLGNLLQPPRATPPADSSPASLLQTMPGSSRAADLAALKKELSTLLESFHQQLEQALAQGGVSRPSSLQIQQDAFGDLRVSGESPQKGDIESTLSNTPGLKELFAAIAETAQLLSAADPNALPLAPAGLDSSAQRTVALSVGSQRTTASFAPADFL